MMELSPDVASSLPRGEDPYRWLSQLDGEVFREVKSRRTTKISVGGRDYYLKYHRGCGWREIIKDLSNLRWPVVSAHPEWVALDRLRELGQPAPIVAGVGIRGWNPAQRESFLLTEALEGMISLEELVPVWLKLEPGRRWRLKRALTIELARVAARLRDAGMNHRDFYLCHFLVPDRKWAQWEPGDPLTLTVIDLHRAQLRTRVPTRWLLKDLAGLLFSALGCSLSNTDLCRFLAHYEPIGARNALRERPRFWRQVARKAVRLYRGHFSDAPMLPDWVRAAERESNKGD